MSTQSKSGVPVPTEFIPLSVPSIRGNEWKYIKECLDTNWVSSVGPFVDRFEEDTARYVGVRHAVATVNGTAALHVALLVAGIQPDDEVLVSTLTFIAPVNAIRYCGAWPVFVDSEPQYGQMDPESVICFLERQCRWKNGKLRNRSTGRRVRAILPVHILGHPVDMGPIRRMARKYDLSIVEDATECLGAEYRGKRVGSLGDIACFSFNGNKIITTGGGGMITTDNQSWAERAKYLTTQAKDHPLEYIHHEIGFNYRLTNLQAAMGCAQLEQLPRFVQDKRRIAASYREQLADIPGLVVPHEAAWAFSTFWMYTVLVDRKKFGMSSREVRRRLDAMRIQSRPLWMPIHRNKPYKGLSREAMPVADRLYCDALSLPCSVGITGPELRRVASAVSALHK